LAGSASSLSCCPELLTHSPFWSLLSTLFLQVPQAGACGCSEDALKASVSHIWSLHQTSTHLPFIHLFQKTTDRSLCSCGLSIWCWGWQTFSTKAQIVNILGFVANMVSIVTKILWL
jgi:hypothetical protein